MTFEEMKKIVVDTLNCDEDKVTMEASLTEDLEADSLDAVELNMALEDACGVSIPDEELAKLTTTSPHISEAKSNERYPRSFPRPNAGAHLPAEGQAGCRCRLARAAVCGVQAVRPPRRTHPVGKKPLRLPQLRLPHAHWRVLPAQSGAGPRQLPGTGCRPASAGCAAFSGLP